ncbi:hypothetical protein QBC44DRAFT_387150 [Cladorrhinum sp. PSN332]|nr:hypothetical protein QBC44DRAFT_387150 [Cladorrhinum sp. PSN332]
MAEPNEDQMVPRDGDSDDLFSDDEWLNPYANKSVPALPSAPIVLPRTTGDVPADSVAPPTEHTSAVETVSTTFTSEQYRADSPESGTSPIDGDDAFDEEELLNMFNDTPEQHINQDEHIDAQYLNAPQIGSLLASADVVFDLCPLTGLGSQLFNETFDLDSEGLARLCAQLQSEVAQVHEAPVRAGSATLPLPSLPFPARDSLSATLHSPAGAEDPPASSSYATHIQLPVPHSPTSVTGTASQDDAFVPLSELKGIRYSNTMTRGNIKVPRRVDQYPAAAIDIMEHVTFKRGIPREELWANLGLTVAEGKAVMNSAAACFKETHSEQVTPARDGKRKARADNKVFLRDLAYRLLVHEGWGVKWFGKQAEGTVPRELVWPADSTKIFVQFTRLLYRTRENTTAKLRQRNQKKKAGDSDGSEPSSSPVPSLPPLQPATPENLVSATGNQWSLPVMAPRNLVHSVPQPVLHNSTTFPSVAPTLTPHLVTAAPNARYIDTPAPSRTCTPSPLVPPAPLSTPNPFASLAQKADETRKRKHAHVAAETNQVRACEVDLPADASLTYIITVKDKTTSVPFSGAQSFRHTNPLIADGAFAQLKASFEVNGHRPLIHIYTAAGPRPIQDVEDWDAAVLGIFNNRQRDVVVDVYI